MIIKINRNSLYIGFSVKYEYLAFSFWFVNSIDMLWKDRKYTDKLWVYFYAAIYGLVVMNKDNIGKLV